MNTIVTNAALQPFQRAEASAHVLDTTWRTDAASVEVHFTGAVRLRDERTARRAAGAAAGAATATVVTVVPNAVPFAVAVAHTPGPVAWSPPPC